MFLFTSNPECKQTVQFSLQAQLVLFGVQKSFFLHHSYSQRLFEKSHHLSKFGDKAIHLTQLIPLQTPNFPICISCHCNTDKMLLTYSTENNMKKLQGLYLVGTCTYKNYMKKHFKYILAKPIAKCQCKMLFVLSRHMCTRAQT